MRPAKASPFGRGVTEGDGEGKPGRKEPLRSDRQALCQSDTIAVPELFVSGLALSVGLAPAKAGLRLPASASLPLASCWPRPQQLLPVSATGGGRRRCPKGGAIGMSVSFRLDAESPTGRKRAGLAAKASGFWTTHLVKLSLAQTAEHYRFRDIVLCSSSGKLSGLPKAPPLGELSSEARLRGPP